MQTTQISQLLSDLPSIVKSNSKIYPEDVSAKYGISLDNAAKLLERSGQIFRAKVGLETDGRHFFQFVTPLVKHGEKTSAEKWQETKDKIAEFAKKAIKFSIGLVMIVYAVIFAVIIIAASSQNKDKRDDNSLDIIGGIFRILMEVLRFQMYSQAFEYMYDPQGHRYRSIRKDNDKGKSFIKAIFNFVVGPDRPQKDPLENEKEFASYIRKNKQKIFATDIFFLNGASLNQADELLVKYLSDFEGELDINPNGIVSAEFYKLNQSTKKYDDAPIIYYFDEVSTPYSLTGNTSGKNAAVVALLLFNLFAPLILGIGLDSVVLGLIPMSLSLIYLAMPIIRYGNVKRKEMLRKAEIAYKDLVKYIYLNPKNKYHVQEIQQFGNYAAKKLIADLQGQIENDQQGNSYVIFHRLNTERGL